MDLTELRPLTLGELLDRTFRLYRNHFWLFVGIMAIPSAFSIPFSVLWMSLLNSSTFRGAPSPRLVLGTGMFALASFALFLCVYAIAIGATTCAVSETYLGQKISVRGAYGKVRGNFWRILGVMGVAIVRAYGMFILVAIAIGIVVGTSIGVMSAIGRAAPKPVIGVIFGIIMLLSYIAGIAYWLQWSLRYAVSIPALLLERVGVLAALRRSVLLTRGRRWQMLVVIFLCSTIAYVGAIVFQGPFFMTMMFSMRGGQIPDWLS
ncbi:MAG: hypothetical protein ACRD4Y_06795, partial [Candidatus Acidiferrales bacterium]